MATWQRMNLSFRYEFWDDARCAAFGFKNVDKIAEQPEWAGKADLMRYEILERHGGVYIDADSECVTPLPDEMLEHDSFACYENETLRRGLISNGYIGATAGNDLMRLLITEAAHRDMKMARAWITVGPMFFTQMVAITHYEKLHIYPSHYFIPKHYSGLEHSGEGPVYAKQHWGSTKNSYKLRAEETPADEISSKVLHHEEHHSGVVHDAATTYKGEF